MPKISIHSPEELSGAAKAILDQAGNERIFLFYGEMGAGKTTFIKAICARLGVTDTISSPTFSIVNEYSGPSTVYHFDLYRLKNETEALDFGLEDYLSSGNYCLVEWPEKLTTLLPVQFLKIEILLAGENSRTIHFSAVTP